MTMQRKRGTIGVREETIRSIPSGGAGVIVTIDGKPYAGFVNRECAEQAVKLWRGEINADGEPIPPDARERRMWRAVVGRKLEIVERET